MKSIPTLIIYLFTAFSIYAQAPQSFNYQGVARDLMGNPMPNQSIGLQVAIMQGSASGTEVYKETHSSTTNNLGLFNIQIGNGIVVNGIFSDINWGDADHFIQIEMDENGGNNYQLIGTSQLMSVPYALFAESGGFWSKNNNGIHFNLGNVGIGTNNPEFPFNIEANDLSNLYFRNNGNSINNGTQLLLGHKEDGFAAYYLDASNGDFSGLDYCILKQRNDLSLELVNLGNNPIFLKTNGDDLNSTRLAISGNGNIGIGTPQPETKLHVSNGDIFIEDINSGIIMKSNDGQCWRMTVSNTGQPIFTSITCPN